MILLLQVVELGIVLLPIGPFPPIPIGSVFKVWPFQISGLLLLSFVWWFHQNLLLFW
jgi:hypothetical protein